ncbi:putative baseplate assembly protein [Streptomyces inhibens]|uniref:Putative baseplate assembly protein n=1 Tax=Streptomyces inhibens TaxID=2293571 RepID=A0A371PUS6_STRIH|nr:putative baseplate assembly protein [Streptomyces inhibens]REK86224.1 putative baseplate assembly protein [Streptomyces inhibens]
MTLPMPEYDGRSRADITGAAAASVRAAQPLWAGRDRTDPGHALIETCADMVEALRDRLNRAPDRHRLELLRMLGVRPYRASASRAEVLFQLAAPSPEPVPVPAGVEVATRPVGAEEPVVFSTVCEALVNPCVLVAAGRFAEKGAQGGVVHGSLTRFGAPGRDAVEPGGLPFAGPPFHLNLPYFGDYPLSADTPVRPPSVATSPGPDVTLAVLSVPVPDTRVTFEVGFGKGLAEEKEVWEAWQGSHWAPCTLVAHTVGEDGTTRITLDIPATHAPARLLIDPSGSEHDARPWQLRDVGLVRRIPQVGPVFRHEPASLALQPVLTVKVPAVQACLVQDEELGRATGQAGERFRFAHPPLLHATDTLTVEALGADGARGRWSHVPSLAASGPDDRHFTLDPRTGEAVFAPVTRTGRGLRRHGAALPEGSLVRAPRYLTGGGTRGNVPARTVTTLRTPLPYVSAVTNPAPATGGTEEETSEAYARRRPLGSPVPERAVTPLDYEELALAASAGMARIHHVRTVTDNTLDPARNLLFAKPADTMVEFTLESDTSSVLQDTEITAAGMVFTTQDEATRTGAARAGVAPLHLDSTVTGATDLFTAGDYQAQGTASGAFRPGGKLVLCLVHIPGSVAPKELALWVKPNTDVPGRRLALSVFLPRTGMPWWNPDAPAAYTSVTADTKVLGGAFPLRLGASPRWRPEDDPPETEIDRAVAGHGSFPPLRGSWLALQIHDPSGDETTTYEVHFDAGTTGEVKALQYALVDEPATAISDETPGQVFQLLQPKVYVAPEQELPEVVVGTDTYWTAVDSFHNSTVNSQHVVINALTGQVHFGPKVGKDQHGAVPGKDLQISVEPYSTTLGAGGNGVERGTACTGVPPGIVSARITKTSANGSDGYTDTSGGTFQAGVRLRVIPAVTADERGWFPFHMLTPTQDACDTLRRALRARQPAGVPVWLETPRYVGIRIEAQVRPADYQTATERSELAAAAEKALYRWFNPVDGGPDGTGWPLGRPVYAGEAYRVLEQVPGLAWVASAALFQLEPTAGGGGTRAETIAFADDQTVYSVEHRVTVAETP